MKRELNVIKKVFYFEEDVRFSSIREPIGGLPPSKWDSSLILFYYLFSVMRKFVTQCHASTGIKDNQSVHKRKIKVRKNI